ncbi:MAG: T9SS type A sorting domain-containing protein [Balneolaceae bacterium]|nr:T9SS type A sorting domain-containing protein [Balneolaceae bacterium]
MQKKLLFLFVLSLGWSSIALAQNAPLKKTFNSGSPALSVPNSAQIASFGSLLLESNDERSRVFIWDTTNVQAPIDSLIIANNATGLKFEDLISINNSILFLFSYNSLNFIYHYDYVEKQFLNHGLENSQLGKGTAFRHLNRVSTQSFIAYDSLNNRLLRFDPDTTGMNNSGFFASKEVDMSAFITANNVGAVGARRDFEVYYVWDKAENALKRFSPEGVEGISFDFDEQTIAPGRELSIESVIVEDNGRIVVAVNDQPSGAAKSTTVASKRLVFFGGGFQYLGDLELPVGGNRGDFSTITDLDVDYDGNIYVTHAADRSIRMLDDFNSPPFNNNTTQYGRVIAKDEGNFYPIEKDLFAFQDWNIEDTVVVARIYPETYTNSHFELYYDADNDGLFSQNEILFDEVTDSLDISIDDIIENRLAFRANSTNPLAGAQQTIFAYRWGDGFGFNPDLNGFVIATLLGQRVIIEGTAGVDGWRLLAPNRIGLTFEEFLEPVWTQGAISSDLPLASPNVFTYNTANEEWQPVLDLNTEIEIGQGFAIYLFEDDDLNTPGVQGGWPKTLTPPIERDGVTGFENFTYPLIFESALSEPEFEGFNLIGNPYTTAYRARDPYLEVDSTTQVLTVWEANYNNGNGRYVYTPISSTNSPASTIAPGQGYWIQANASNAMAEYHTNGITLAERNVNKLVGNHSFLTVNITDNGFSDVLGIHSADIRAQKLTSLSDYYHEVFAIDSDDKKLAITGKLVDEPITIELGVRSTVNSIATFNVTTDVLSEFNGSILLRYELSDGSVQEFDLRKTSPSISLVKNGEEWKEEGKLFLLLNHQQTVSNGNENELPVKFEIGAYPNPFNPATNIQYQLPNASNVRVEVFNTLGQRIMELNDLEFKRAGTHNLRLDLSKQNSGVYFVRITANNQVSTQSITLIK